MAGRIIYQTRARGILGIVWRSLVIGLGYALAITVGGMVARAMGLPVPEMASRVDPVQALVTTFLSGMVIGLTLGPLSAWLALPTVERAGVLFVVIFVLNALINVIEALFFTTIPAAEQAHGLVTSAIGHAGLAVLPGAALPASVCGAGTVDGAAGDSQPEAVDVLGLALWPGRVAPRAHLPLLRLSHRPHRLALLRQSRPGAGPGGAWLRVDLYIGGRPWSALCLDGIPAGYRPAWLPQVAGLLDRADHRRVGCLDSHAAGQLVAAHPASGARAGNYRRCHRAGAHHRLADGQAAGESRVTGQHMRRAG